jgi:hypothetical protein
MQMLVPNIVTALSSSFLDPLFHNVVQLEAQLGRLSEQQQEAVFKVIRDHGLGIGKTPSSKLTAIELILELVIGLMDMKLVCVCCFVRLFLFL